MVRRDALLLTAVLAAAACANPNAGRQAGGALVGTGFAVAAAAVNRAVNKDCWAACRPGTVCDKASGLCVEPGSRRASPGAAPSLPTDGPLPEPRETEIPPLPSADAGAPEAAGR